MSNFEKCVGEILRGYNSLTSEEKEAIIHAARIRWIHGNLVRQLKNGSTHTHEKTARAVLALEGGTDYAEEWVRKPVFRKALALPEIRLANPV